MSRLQLPSVTLCAATSVNLTATLAAIRVSMEKVTFGDVILFTETTMPAVPEGVRLVPILPIKSSPDYSEFIIEKIAAHIRTNHCLVIQWDGFVLDPAQWDPRFLDFDYVGAPWPQFNDGHDVGNGGFSLRSRKLLEACRGPNFIRSHPEDVAIGRINRNMLERDCGIRFADRATAARFSFERFTPSHGTFGFHGVFNMIPLLGSDRFWAIYDTLDDRSAVTHDYPMLMRQLGSGTNTLARRAQLTLNQGERFVPLRLRRKL